MAELISRNDARVYWRALVENAVGLIRDAATLLDTSAGRSRSLLVLAQEQLGQSAVLYDLASAAWSSQSGDVVLSDRFVSLERMHPSKLVAAIEQDDELDSFWGDYSREDAEADLDVDDYLHYLTERDARRKNEAAGFNAVKQAGFYVDRTPAGVRAPQDQERGTLPEEIRRAAGVAEMLLVRDHTRQQAGADGYESAQDLHAEVLPYAHPEEFLELMQRVNGDAEPPQGDGIQSAS